MGRVRYYRRDGESTLDDAGFFETGDIATINAKGFMQITDRHKDAVGKSIY